MLVYGDQAERADPAERLRAIHAGLRPDREGLMAALVEAGRVEQGLADAGCQGRLHVYLLGLANAALGKAAPPALPDLAELPREVELRVPEGYAFYALYPEAYAEAALRLRLEAPPRVVGIRSIGTSLAAMVAAALGSETFFTVRPAGEPFARTLEVAPETARALLAGAAHFIIVDEGPGLSGSSFGAVAGWLEARGVPRARIAFLPSHDGLPGPQASAAHRQCWQEAQREVGDFGASLGARLATWAEPLLGRLDAPLEEISGGSWRHRHYQEEAAWPAADPVWERRKFLARAGGETWLLKFAGLGAIGQRKLALARRLHAAGWSPEPRGLAHGFLVERWHGEAQPAGHVPTALLAAYIASRRTFPAGSGASLAELLAMIRRNAGLALGDDAAAGLHGWEEGLPLLAKRVRRVCTDNRLLPHEWLRLPDGRLLKCDAVDHHAGHDLIGCQDAAWDIAGAAVEFDLDAAALAGEVGDVDPELLAFSRLAYLAFRVGQAGLSVDMTAGELAEQARHRRAFDRYRALLAAALPPANAAATRPVCPVGLPAE